MPWVKRGRRLDGPIVGSGWKPGWGGNAGAMPQSGEDIGGFNQGRSFQRTSAARLAGNVPLPPSRPSAESLAKTVPAANGPGTGAGGGKGSSRSVHAPITINGANSDPETLANLVQKRVQEAGHGRTHDWDHNAIT